MVPATRATKAQQSDAMAPSALDLLMLTFNCAKEMINVGLFAKHLQAAVEERGNGLPDLVVL